MQEELAHLGMQDAECNQLFHLWELLQKALKADEEIKLLDRDYISDGYHEEVDKLRKIAYHSDELLLEYQQFLVNETGVNNVKLKFVMNQGYFIEVTTRDMPIFEKKLNTSSSDMLALSRRNTLKDNQRYSSPYLEEIQQSILSSKDELTKREYNLLGALAQEVSACSTTLFLFAQKIAELDVYCSHALFALEQRYIQPELNTTNILHIEGGRHPVIEAYLPRDQQFIPNDLLL
jgi:DNA mismatch repair protein MutS